MSDKFSESSRSETTGNESTGWVTYLRRERFGLADNVQEAVEKYQQSKKELDEVVAQMESLVS